MAYSILLQPEKNETRKEARVKGPRKRKGKGQKENPGRAIAMVYAHAPD